MVPLCATDQIGPFMEKKMRDTKLSYPIDEGFEVLGVTRTAGYKLIAEGKLDSFKVGKRRNVTHKALEKCLELLQQETKGKAA